MSPDTDVFIIGLALQSTYQKEVIVQLSAYSARELRLLNLSSLTSALRNDPDLGRLNNSDLPKIVQSLYACTGCDYISFFSTIGKSTFMRYFHQYAGFISGDTDHAPGSLSDVSLLDHKWKRGFLAFLRLIGVVYFKKHSSGFDIQSPLSLYSKFEDLSIEQQHYKWIDRIRQTMWYRTNFENEMLASNDALMLHWKRTCWILHMWNQADNNQMVLQPITEYGWNIKSDVLTIQWDTENNEASIRERVHLLTRGCKCTSGCGINHCGCRKRQHKCTAGCECTHCKNVFDSCDKVIEIVCTNEEECEEQDEEFEKDEEYEEQDEECEEKDDNDCEELENIMEFVFGSEQISIF